MPDFAFLAIDPQGREKRGDISATSLPGARARLEARKLYVVKLAPREGQPRSGSAPTSVRTLLRPSKLNAKQLTLFTRQLSTMTQVSPLEESLRTIARQSEQDHVRVAIGRVADKVVEGRRLADALASEPRSFPPLYRAMVAAGETSGSLPALLERLAALLERQAEMRGKLLSALAYPIVLTLVAIGVVAALMIAVVPKVVEQFDDVGQQLPLLTRIVIGISSFLAAYWWIILLVLALAALGLWQAMKQPRYGSRSTDLCCASPCSAACCASFTRHAWHARCRR